jgi:predicted metal-dependent HD superfamily phosphohydrolase
LHDEVAPLLHDRDAVEMALWFHDAIYVPGAADNERRSAKLFADRATGIDAIFGRRVCALILATRHTGRVQGRDRAFTVDIDLAGFGAPWEEFMRQGDALRAEFHSQDDAQYYAGQIAFLKRLQQRRRFFATDYFRIRHEHAAQENLARLLTLRLEQGYRGD